MPIISGTSTGSSAGSDNAASEQRLEFKPLSELCPRGAFACGEQAIDKWFKSNSVKCQRKFQSRVTTVHLKGNQVPVGFYSLRITSDDNKLLPTKNPLSIWRNNGSFPALQLEYLAVNSRMQGSGLGRLIMGEVIEDFYRAIQQFCVPVLIGRAINRRVLGFYMRLGFGLYGDPDDPMPRLLLPADAVIDLKEKAQPMIAHYTSSPPE